MDARCWSSSASNSTDERIEIYVAACRNGTEVRPKEVGGSEEAQLTEDLGRPLQFCHPQPQAMNRVR
jgi:hypothetical protein